MPDPTLTLAVLGGICLAVAPLLVVRGARVATPRLADALDQVSGRRRPAPSLQVPEGADRWDRWGARLAAGRLGWVAPPLRRTLDLQGRSVADFMVEKSLWAGAGLVLPVLVSVVGGAMGLHLPASPVVVGPLLAVAGWFLPDLRVRSQRGAVNQDSARVVLSYIDLVTLARLANQSATRCLVSAAVVSDHAVLVRVRTVLDRARLEQQPPWAGLETLSRELDLPQLAELVEVLRLDEQGASLSQTLRARVAEMRDAHLSRERLEAQRVSESLTVWMVVPVVVLGLALLTPALLRLSGVAS